MEEMVFPEADLSAGGSVAGNSLSGLIRRHCGKGFRSSRKDSSHMPASDLSRKRS